MSKRRVLHIGAILLALVVLTELGFRLAEPLLGVDRGELQGLRELVCEGRSASYEPRAYTVYVRNREREDTNALGLRGAEWSLEKTPGVLRIAALGGSTTEGAWPLALAAELEQRTKRRFEVLNAGLSGWTSAESLVNWFLNVQDYAPDLVVLHHAVNDVAPRLRRGHRSDYSHYRHPWQPPRSNALQRLLLRASDVYAALWLRRGIPDVGALTTWPVLDPLDPERGPLPYPEGALTFRRNLRTIGRHARSLGAEVVLMTMPGRPPGEGDTPHDRLLRRGLLEHNEILRALAAEEGWMLVDLEAAYAADPSTTPWFLDLVHQAVEGRRHEAVLLAEALVRDWEALR